MRMELFLRLQDLLLHLLKFALFGPREALRTGWRGLRRRFRRGGFRLGRGLPLFLFLRRLPLPEARVGLFATGSVECEDLGRDSVEHETVVGDQDERAGEFAG